jgi:hypothetical protein
MFYTQLSSPAQRTAIAAACARQGLDKEMKQQLVHQYSQGRTTSSTQLTRHEAAALLAAIAKPGSKPANQDDAAARMRRQVIAIFHECGWHTEREPVGGSQNRPKIDMNRVNAWCIQHGYLHKKLNAYTYQELPKLVTQAKKYLEWYLKKL